MKKACIQVHQRFGEQLRVLLIEQGFFDLDFPITRERSWLYFPLNKRLTTSEMSALEQKITSLTQVERNLEPVSRKPADLSVALKEILPEELHHWLPRSMDIIGEIAIVELNEMLLPFDAQIGEAIMAVNSKVSTVYIKEGGVEGACRIRPLRLIAGRGQTSTIHTEYGIKIAVDVTQAYFSPRLGTEHNRVSRLVQSGEVIVDMFTGVGSFALLTAKRQPVQVFAIDINPRAIKCLRKSIELNRLEGNIVPIVGDARIIIKNQLLGKADRIIMNLPNEAFSFLDAAAIALKPKGGVIHFYGVISETRSQESLGTDVVQQLAEYGWMAEVTRSRIVRPAAPHEDQVVLDLHLTPG